MLNSYMGNSDKIVCITAINSTHTLLSTNRGTIAHSPPAISWCIWATVHPKREYSRDEGRRGEDIRAPGDSRREGERDKGKTGGGTKGRRNAFSMRHAVYKMGL